MGSQQEKEVLINALKQLEEKNQQLKQTLSAETKLKLDLFSALGEAKRELQIKTSQFLTYRQSKKLQNLLWLYL